MPDEKYRIWLEPSIRLDSDQLKKDIETLKDTIQKSVNSLTDEQLKLKMEFTKVDTGMFKNIQSEIINIGKLLDDLKKKDFSTVINIDPGQKSSAQMELLAQKARLLTQQVQNSLDKISGMRGISATMEQLNQLLVFQSKFQPDKIYERIDNAMGGKTSARMENIISELNKDLNLLTEITGVKLDTSRIDELDKALQGTSNSAEKLVESINNAIQPLSSKSVEIKDVLGIEGVQTSVKQIDDMFTDLRAKIETALDLSTINMHVEAINAQIDKIDVDKAVKDALEGNTKIDVKVNVGADTEAINRTKDDIKQIAENVASIDLSKADQIKTKFKGLADGTSEVASETERWKEITDEAIVSLERVKATDKEGNAQVQDSLTIDYAAREQLRERETAAINKQNAAYQKYLAEQEAARQKELDLLQKAEIAQREYEESLRRTEEEAERQYEREINLLDERNRKLDEEHESKVVKQMEKEEAAAKIEADAFVTLDTNVGKYIARQKEYVAAAEKAGFENDENVQTLKTMISCLEALQNGIRNLEYSDVKEATSEFHNLQNATEEAARSVKEVTKISVKSTAEDAKTKAETLKAVARYEAIRKQIINDINKSSKAEHGKSSQDYSNLVQYRDAVEQLYQEYTHGSKSLQDFRDSLENIANGAAGASNNIRQAGEMTMSFGDRIKKAMGNLSTYFGVSRMIMQVVRYTRDLIKTSIDLDKEMTQLRIVTNETEQAYSDYSASIARTAREISSSMSDLISATTTFARLGYSLDESSVLAKYTAMLQQVGDIDAQAAQNAITAITKAFADEVDISNIESVMDRLVIVGRMVAHICSNAYLVIGYNGQSRFGMIA